MTAIQSKLVITDDGQMVRARVLPDAAGAPVIELTQLHRRSDGMGADHARVFLPLDKIEDLTSAMQALRAEALNARAQAEGRNRLSPVARKPPAKASRYSSEGF